MGSGGYNPDKKDRMWRGQTNGRTTRLLELLSAAKNQMICFIRGRKKSSKLRNSSYENQAQTKMKILDKKKHCVLDFGNAPGVMFLDY